MLRSNQLSYTTENQALQNQQFFSKRLAPSSQKLYTKFAEALKWLNNLTWHAPAARPALRTHHVIDVARQQLNSLGLLPV
jgi:hypothetical protein